jgi:glutathione synthase/RimK-type ligase-like ATP-grasp enzyme
MLGLIAPDAFWVNPADAAINAGYKMLQHRSAVVLGLKAPDTLYSNDPRQIRAFIQRHGGEIVYKPLRGLPWQGEKSILMSFTSRLTEDQLVEDDLLRSAPGIYQQMIPKAFELRVTVMGHCILAAQISSQDTERGRLDWRRAPEEIKAKPFDLPPNIADLCHLLMAKLGIVFGCFDFIVTPDGDYVFLEVNEAGQFLFLEQDTNLPLLDCFSDFLLDGRADFVGHQGEAKIRYAEVLDTAKREIEQALTLHCNSPEAFSNDDRRAP